MKKKALPHSVFLFGAVLYASSSPGERRYFNIDFETYSAAIELVNLDTDTIVYQKNCHSPAGACFYHQDHDLYHRQ